MARSPNRSAKPDLPAASADDLPVKNPLARNRICTALAARVLLNHSNRYNAPRKPLSRSRVSRFRAAFTKMLAALADKHGIPYLTAKKLVGSAVMRRRA